MINCNGGGSCISPSSAFCVLFISSAVAIVNHQRAAAKHVDLELSCSTGNHDKDDGGLLPTDDLIVRCNLISTEDAGNWSPAEVTQGIHGKFNTVIANSTFHKSFEWIASPNQTSWELLIDRMHLFERYSDLELPKAHPNSILKWSLITQFRSPLLPDVLYHRMAVSYIAADPAYRFDWGEPVLGSLTNQPDSDQHQIFAHLPCKPGSGFLILSSSSRTVVATTWNAFKSEDVVRWYDATILLQEAVYSSEPPTVYDAAISSDRLLFITSNGVLSSASFSGMCWETDSQECRKMSFSKINVPGDVENSDWSSASFAHSSACSNMDAILPNDDRTFLKTYPDNGTLRILELVALSQSWLVADGLSLRSSHASLSYDAYSDILHMASFSDSNSKSTAYVISFFNVKPYKQQTNVTLSEFIPKDSIALPPTFIFLVGETSIFYSNDAGTSYEKLYQMDPGEKVVNAVSHDREKSVAFLFNSGKILVWRVGIAGHLQAKSDLTNPSIVTFDDKGDLYVTSITWDQLAAPRINSRMVDLKTEEVCSLSLVPHEPALVESVVYLDVGGELVIKATAFASNSDNEAKFPLLSSSVSNSKLLQAHVELTKVTEFSQQIHITVENNGRTQGSGAVTIMLRNAEPSCVFTSYTVNIAFSCPPEKRLVFDYSSFVEKENLLTIEKFVNLSTSPTGVRLLQKNYRPPSALGISIPLSKNVYNFDSATSQDSRILDYDFLERYGVAEGCGGIKQSACKCSSAMKFSSLEKFSYCRQRVYEVKYDIEYHINVSVEDGEGYSKKYAAEEYLIYLEEVNGRGEDVYSVSDGNNRLCAELDSHGICNEYSGDAGEDYYKKTIDYMSYGTGKTLFNSTMVVIRFLGTGLFHFRIVLSQGYSHCKLQDEFQVYVTNPPLPFPVGTIVRLTVSVAMGAALVIIYMKTVTTQIPKIAPAEEYNTMEKPQPTRRINASHVNEGDVANLRNKFRASFQASQR